MHPLVRGAAAAAVLTALGSLDRPPPAPGPSSIPASEPHGVDGLPAPCGPGTLPEGPVCLRIPGEDRRSEPPAPASGASPGATMPARDGVGADSIPRLPERPADPSAYVYPLGQPGHPLLLIAPGAEGPGVRVAARPGEKIVLLGLAGQDGPAEVVFVGDLHGQTVVTAHTVVEGTRRRTYLLVHGLLDRAAPDVAPGAKLESGAVLGFARASRPHERGEGSAAEPSREGREGLIDVYLEARELRDGAPLDAGKRLMDAARSVPTDVRNVLPLREPAGDPQGASLYPNP